MVVFKTTSMIVHAVSMQFLLQCFLNHILRKPRVPWRLLEGFVKLTCLMQIIIGIFE